VSKRKCLTARRPSVPRGKASQSKTVINLEVGRLFNSRKIISGAVTAALAAGIVVSAYSMLRIQGNYTAEAATHETEISRFSPSAADTAVTTDTADARQSAGPGAKAVSAGSAKLAAADSTAANQRIKDLQAQHEDAAGWINIPYTDIDYPFVQGTDNAYYLNRDINGKNAAAGTIFMDCRNARDLSDFNTIIYGHHMKNGTMFGALKEFQNRDFFDSRKTGTVYLADRTYELEFFAFLVIQPNDAVIFSIPTGDSSKRAFLGYVKDTARFYRDIGVTAADKIVTLSTCSYEFRDARMVLLGRLCQEP